MSRPLSKQEIEILKLQRCSSENWENIEVMDPFVAGRLQDVKFSGNIKLGTNGGTTPGKNGIAKPAGIRNCFIHNCTIGNEVFLSDVGTLANYTIGDQVTIEQVGTLQVTQTTSFGNGHEIDVLNEGGGRELPIFDRLTAQIAYLMVLYRHDNAFTEKLKAMIDRYVQTCASATGKVGAKSKILFTKTIRNVNVGPDTTIRGASLLEEGTISGNASAPVFIGENVSARNFIILSGSAIDGGAIISSSFVGQGVQIGRQFSAENSVFFANCEAFHGEACSIFAGPYTVTHHKSTLLIAGLFSFYNAGSGTNQSNHMYKLGPIHQGIVERGCKTGSFSYMLWPCRVGPFSVVMDKHAGNFDASEFPFSYISVEGGKSVLTPAMNLFTVGTARDNKKWPKRDRRKDPEKRDLIHFHFLNPYTAGKILKGIKHLEHLHETTPKTREFVSHKGLHINRLMLRTAKRYYELALTVYLTGSLVCLLENSSFKSMKDIRQILAPDTASEKGIHWVDMAGMLSPKSDVEILMNNITEGKVTTVEELQAKLQEMHGHYVNEEWSWCAHTLNSWKQTDMNQMTKEQLISLISGWKNSVVKFNNMILKDAEKEFDALSHIGFGLDGNEAEKKTDFENIRGHYETNAFIMTIKKESEDAGDRFQALIKKIEHLPE